MTIKSITLIALCILLELSVLPMARGQDGYYPRDSSYTIATAYQKAVKNYPEIKPVWPNLPKGVLEYSNLIYARPDKGRNLYLDIYRKNNKHVKPLIILIHGGGWVSGSKENMTPMAMQFAKKGYVAATVEYRLAREAMYPAAVQDLKAAIRWLRSHSEEYGIDPSRIAVYGTSAGAHLATLLGATNAIPLFEGPNMEKTTSAEVQAVLNIDGITSFVHKEAEPEWNGNSANSWLGRYEDHYDRWKEASPLEYVGEHFPPILFVNSSFPRFHAGRDDMIQILENYEIYSEVHTFEKSPHGFWMFDPWFEPTFEYSLKFLKRIFK